MHARRPAHSSLVSARRTSRRPGTRAFSAGVAQLAEHLFCKQVVGGSSPPASSTLNLGGLPERPKGAGCKPAGIAYVGSNPTPSTRLFSVGTYLRAEGQCHQERSGQIFVCGLQGVRVSRLGRPARAGRRPRRFFEGLSISFADRELVFQDSGVDPGSAVASPGSKHGGPLPSSGDAGHLGPVQAGWGTCFLREIWPLAGAGAEMRQGARLVQDVGGGSIQRTSRVGSPAGVAQLVEHQPSKLNVEGSNPFSRSTAPHTARRIGRPT
jgi:hypothetical protein